MFLEYVALNRKYRVENQSNFMLCYKSYRIQKKKLTTTILLPPAADLVKQTKNYENRTESSVNYCKKKTILKKEEEKLVATTAKQKSRKSPIGYSGDQKQQREAKNQICKKNITQKRQN